MQAGTDIGQIPCCGSIAAHPGLMAGCGAFIVDTLPAVLGHVQTDKLKALVTPSRERIAALGTEVVASTPGEAQGFLHSEVEKWSAVAASARIEKQ